VYRRPLKKDENLADGEAAAAGPTPAETILTDAARHRLAKVEYVVPKVTFVD
jgi:hypothetical protein